MPRGPRLDAPDTLHHVMARGIERRRLFGSATDCEDFVARLAAVVDGTGLRVLAWALVPNHVHLLVRTGPPPLPTAMRRLLTGYAVGYNRRHRRHGHLCQHRDKSIVVEEEPYRLEVTRYIHLHPLRAQVVRDLAALDRYPWSGCRARGRPWTKCWGSLGGSAPAPGNVTASLWRPASPRAGAPSCKGVGCGGAPGAGRGSSPSAAGAKGGPPPSALSDPDPSSSG